MGYIGIMENKMETTMFRVISNIYEGSGFGVQGLRVSDMLLRVHWDILHKDMHVCIDMQLLNAYVRIYSTCSDMYGLGCRLEFRDVSGFRLRTFPPQ